MNIKVLGTGCSRCNKLEKNVRDAVAEMNITADISKVEDIIDIMNYGIMRTPGLVINEKVVSVGQLLTVSQVKEILDKNN